MSLLNQGGSLRDVELSRPHVIYGRQPAARHLTSTTHNPRTQWELQGTLGKFKVDIKAEGQEDPSFDISYTTGTSRVGFGRTYNVKRAAFMRFVRTGDNDEIDRDTNALFPQSYLRTDPYSGYRVDRIHDELPFSEQRSAQGQSVSFALARGDFIDVENAKYRASESYSGELFERMTRRKTPFFRFEAISALVDYNTGQIFEAIEWGLHMEQGNPNEFATCTVYAPSLLYRNMQSNNTSLRRAATERELGMKLAMARWNNDYALLVEKLFNEPRFSFLANLPSLGFITSWHRARRLIQKIPGEQQNWVYPADQRVDISPPRDGTANISPSYRPLAVFPLQPPSPPPNPPVRIGTAYTLGVAAVITELKRINVNPRAISGPDHPLWLSARRRLERARKKTTDWVILEEMLSSLNEKFRTAAKAARRKLDSPPPGYLERGRKWMDKQFPDANLHELGPEDDILSSVEKDDIVKVILRDNELLEGSGAVAKMLHTKGVGALLGVCNELWQVYTIEMGDLSTIRGYSMSFNHAPKWFRDLQAYMPQFYGPSNRMMDPADDPDGSQTDPLLSPAARGFVHHEIGFLVDGRSLAMLKAARAIIPPITYPAPSFKADSLDQMEAERIHPEWAAVTHIAKGNAFYRRGTMEFDYQTAVVVTRSPAGLFRFVRGRGYLYAVAVPKSGVDLEAAQHYFSEVLQDVSKISRAGEKAYREISYEKLLAEVVLETASTDESEYPEFYRYVGSWEFTAFAQSRKQKDYINAALAPPFVPVPLCCYRELSQAFVDVRFENNPVHSEGIVGVPAHVWNDFQAVYQHQNMSKNEQQELNDNALLAVEPEFSEQSEQVQESTELTSEKQRKAFVAMVNTADADVTHLERLEQLVYYPAWFLNANLLHDLKDEVEKVKKAKGQVSHTDLVKYWHSMLGPRVQMQPFTITPPFVNSEQDASLNKLRQYFKLIRSMMDPDKEEVIQTSTGNRKEVRWPVSPQPRGFVDKLIGFFVAFPATFKDTVEKDERKKKLYPEFSKSGRLSSVWKDIDLQDKDFIFNSRGSSLIPESCIFISRTVEGALMTAKPNNDPSYGLDPKTAQRVYAIRLAEDMTGFDLEKFQKDQVIVPSQELGWDAAPGVKALSLQTALQERDILASVPIQRLDKPPLKEFASVNTFGNGLENPRELPVLFHFRPLKPQWEYMNEVNVSDDDKIYLEKAFPKVWFPSFTKVDGRVHVEAPVNADARPVTMEDIEKATTDVNENPRSIKIFSVVEPNVGAPSRFGNPAAEYSTLAKLSLTATGLLVETTQDLQRPENADQANAVVVPPVPEAATFGFRSVRAPNARFAVSHGFTGCFIQVWRTPNNQVVLTHVYKGGSSTAKADMDAYGNERKWTKLREIDTAGLVIPSNLTSMVGLPSGTVIVDLDEGVPDPRLMLFRVYPKQENDVIAKVLVRA